MQTYRVPLLHATVRTFEELCLLAVDGEQDHPAPNDDVMVTSVRFRGPTCGALVVRAARGVAAAAATNMLGDDDAAAQQGQLDALKEIANVICGHTLPLMAGREAVFDVEPPREGPGPGATSKVNAVVCVATESGAVEVTLHTDGA
jgi:CheY-specific phosphatase CheX